MCFRFGVDGANTETALGEKTNRSDKFLKFASPFWGPSIKILICPTLVQLVKIFIKIPTFIICSFGSTVVNALSMSIYAKVRVDS